jgi:hypothetical protein
MPPVGFEPTIPVSERPKTHALDRTATGIDNVPCRKLNECIKQIPLSTEWLFYGFPQHGSYRGIFSAHAGFVFYKDAVLGAKDTRNTVK